MTDQPYDQQVDAEFDRLTSYYRHPGGRTMSQADRTPEDKRATALQMLGCSTLLLAASAGAALIIAAWRLL